MIPQVGQRLYMCSTEPRYRDHGHEVLVLKVSRKWVTVARPEHTHLDRCYERFDHTDPRWPVGSKGGYTTSTRVWPSKEAWQRELDRDDARFALHAVVMDHGYLHPTVTAENLRECARLLGRAEEFEKHLARVRARK